MKIFLAIFSTALALVLMRSLGSNKLESAPVEAGSTDRQRDDIHQIDSVQHSMLNKVKAMSQRPSYAEEWRLMNPNKYYKPGNSTFEYARNYRRHNEIAQYYYSPIKDHPSMQAMLQLLIENGYDVFDWVKAVVVLTDFHRPVELVRSRMVEAGFSEAEMELLLRDVVQQQQQRKAWHVSELKGWSNIEDESVIEEILNLDFPLDVTQSTMLGRKQLEPGDRFLTEEDWESIISY